jgi:hypothetical protein
MRTFTKLSWISDFTGPKEEPPKAAFEGNSRESEEHRFTGENSQEKTHLMKRGIEK